MACFMGILKNGGHEGDRHVESRWANDKSPSKVGRYDMSHILAQSKAMMKLHGELGEKIKRDIPCQCYDADFLYKATILTC